MSIATLGGGCFWCLEAIFRRIIGISSVQPGYSGGHILNPTYQQVCSGQTGDAEVVQITFDPVKINFETILKAFFSIHDPTTLNRQGGDVGTQYRSVIFFHDESQKNTAINMIMSLRSAGAFGGKPIVTEITPFTSFYPAEPYHKDYYETNPNSTYCCAVIKPKIAQFQNLFKDLIV